MQTTIIEPMPETLRLRLPGGLILEVDRDHPRGRTYAFLWLGRGCLWCGRSAEA